jgi:exonuclease III
MQRSSLHLLAWSALLLAIVHGCFCCCSIESVVSWAPYHGSGSRIGEASHPGPRPLRICTLNINSLRLHLPEVANLDWDIACLQESGCNSSNIHIAHQICKDLGMDLFHGPLLACDQVGGVAICSKAYHLLDTYVDNCEYFDNLISTKRWKHSTIPLSKNKALNLHTIYGYSGANSRAESARSNETFLQLLLLEASKGGEAPSIIMGDFNVDPLNSPTLQHALSNLGWVDVLQAFGDTSNTFHSSYEYFVEHKGSRIDLVLANPTALAIITDARVCQQRLVGGHSPVIIEIDGDRANITGYRLDPIRPFVTPPVLDQDPGTRQHALIQALAHSDRFHGALKSQDLSYGWSILNTIIDDFLRRMENGHFPPGEEKTKGFTVSVKSILPPTTTSRGVASATEKHLLHVQKTINMIHDLQVQS